jgi:hypothetical protein
MNNKTHERKRTWPNLKYYSSIFLERLVADTENLSQNSWIPGGKFNAGFPKHEAGEVLLARLWRVLSVKLTIYGHKT